MQKKTADDGLFLPFNGFLKILPLLLLPLSILLLAGPILAISPPSNFSPPYPSPTKAHTTVKNAELAIPQLSFLSSDRRGEHTEASFAAHYMTKCTSSLLVESHADSEGCL